MQYNRHVYDTHGVVILFQLHLCTPSYPRPSTLPYKQHMRVFV